MSPFLLLVALQAEKPSATVKLNASMAVVGKPLQGTLTINFPEGQHGYQNPPADESEIPIKFGVMGTGFKMAKVLYPKGTEMKMDGAPKPSMVYEGTITIPFTVVATKALPKATSVSFQLDYQLCTLQNCFPPASLVIKAPLKVVAAVKAAKKP